jgi:hypothetical protein
MTIAATCVCCADVWGFGDLTVDGGGGNDGGAGDQGNGSGGSSGSSSGGASDAADVSIGDGGAGENVGVSDADAGDSFVCAADNFPDGGWYCGCPGGGTPCDGGSWLNVPNYFICSTHDGVTSNSSPPSTWCTESCVSCATCNGVAYCKAIYDAGFLGCVDPNNNGEVTINCAP